jgi:hypothetical protein
MLLRHLSLSGRLSYYADGSTIMADYEIAQVAATSFNLKGTTRCDSCVPVSIRVSSSGWPPLASPSRSSPRASSVPHFPLLLVAACPLSMVVMMLAMRQQGHGSRVPDSGTDRAADLRRELLDLKARQRGLETELATLEGSDRRPVAVVAPER